MIQMCELQIFLDEFALVSMQKGAKNFVLQFGVTALNFKYT